MWVTNHTKRCFLSQFAYTSLKSAAVLDCDVNILGLDYLVALVVWKSFRRSFQRFVQHEHA